MRGGVGREEMGYGDKERGGRGEGEGKERGRRGGGAARCTSADDCTCLQSVHRLLVSRRHKHRGEPTGAASRHRIRCHGLHSGGRTPLVVLLLVVVCIHPRGQPHRSQPLHDAALDIGATAFGRRSTGLLGRCRVPTVGGLDGSGQVVIHAAGQREAIPAGTGRCLHVASDCKRGVWLRGTGCLRGIATGQ